MQARLLPGEPSRLPGEPNDRIRYVHSLPLDAFRLVHEDGLSWSRDLVWAYRRALFRSSRNRRMRTGAQGLMRGAARIVIREFEPAVIRMYRNRRMTVLLTDESRDELAAALAIEECGNPSLKQEVTNALRAFRISLANSAETVELIPNMSNYIEDEEIIETVSRWLDELDYIREHGDYRPVIHIHRALVNCSRVWNAVFDSEIDG